MAKAEVNNDRRGRTQVGWSRLLESYGGELLARMNRVRHLIGDAHWGEEGAYKEILVRSLIREVAPERFEVSTGFIHWSEGVVSSQIDVLIWDREGPAPYLRRGEFVVVPAEAVVGVLEVKTKLDRRSLRDALDGLHPEMFRSYANLTVRSPIRGIIAFGHDLPTVNATPVEACFQEITSFYGSRYGYVGGCRSVMALREPVAQASSTDADAYRWSEIAHPRFYNLIDAVCVVDTLQIEQCRIYYREGRGRRRNLVGIDPGLVGYAGSVVERGGGLARFILLIRDLLNRRLASPVYSEVMHRVGYQPPLASPAFCVFGPRGGRAEGIWGSLAAGTAWSPERPLWEDTGPPVVLERPSRARNENRTGP